jgi:replicative DNA helicase
MSAEAEVSLLGACLSAAFALPAAQEEGVTAEDFSRPSHQAIWQAMLAVSGELAAGEHVDPMLVAAKLNGQLEAVGGRAYIHSLPNACPLVSNARKYAREVIDSSLKRKVRKIILELQDSDLSGAGLLSELQDRAFALERKPREARKMSDAFKEVYEEAANPTRPVCSYPWREVDYCTRGLRPGWLVYLAGESSQGKTAAALEIAEHAIGEGKTVLFLSLEMTAFELAVRLAQRNGFRSEILYGRMNASREDFAPLLKLIGRDKWERLRIERVDNVGQIGAVVRRVKPDLVILDYIQLLDIGRDSRLEGTTKNSRALKMLAQRYQLPVIALSQLSRAPREERTKLPGLWRLRDSGALEQDADAVIFVWRQRGENGEGLLPNGSFVIAKARMGHQGKVDFLFDGGTQKFTLVSNRSEP